MRACAPASLPSASLRTTGDGELKGVGGRGEVTVTGGPKVLGGELSISLWASSTDFGQVSPGLSSLGACGDLVSGVPTLAARGITGLGDAPMEMRPDEGEGTPASPNPFWWLLRSTYECALLNNSSIEVIVPLRP